MVSETSEQRKARKECEKREKLAQKQAIQEQKECEKREKERQKQAKRDSKALAQSRGRKRDVARSSSLSNGHYSDYNMIKTIHEIWPSFTPSRTSPIIAKEFDRFENVYKENQMRKRKNVTAVDVVRANPDAMVKSLMSAISGGGIEVQDLMLLKSAYKQLTDTPTGPSPAERAAKTTSYNASVGGTREQFIARLLTNRGAIESAINYVSGGQANPIAQVALSTLHRASTGQPLPTMADIASLATPENFVHAARWLGGH